MNGDGLELSTIKVMLLSQFFAMIRDEFGDRSRTGTTPFQVFADGSGAYEHIADAISDPRVIVCNMRKDQFDQGVPRNAHSGSEYDDAERESLEEFETDYAGPATPCRKEEAIRIFEECYLPVTMGNAPPGHSYDAYLGRDKGFF